MGEWSTDKRMGEWKWNEDRIRRRREGKGGIYLSVQAKLVLFDVPEWQKNNNGYKMSVCVVTKWLQNECVCVFVCVCVCVWGGGGGGEGEKPFLFIEKYENYIFSVALMSLLSTS